MLWLTGYYTLQYVDFKLQAFNSGNKYQPSVVLLQTYFQQQIHSNIPAEAVEYAAMLELSPLSQLPKGTMIAVAEKRREGHCPPVWPPPHCCPRTC